MATLQVIREGKLLRTVDLGDGVVRVGRAAENDVVLEDTGAAVSRFHAEVRPSRRGHVVVNLSQPHGLRAEGERVERWPLVAGQEVEIGPYTLKVAAAATDAPEAPTLVGVVSRQSVAAPAVESPVVAALAAAPDVVPSVAPASVGHSSMALPPPPVAAKPAPVVPFVVTTSTSAPPTSAVPEPVAVPADVSRGDKALAGLVTAGAIAAGIVAVVAVGWVVAPSGMGEPQVASASPAPVVTMASSNGALDVPAELTRAREAMQEGRFESALADHLRPVLAAYPDNAEALTLKVRAEEGRRPDEPAREASSTATATGRDEARAAGGRGASIVTPPATARGANGKILRKPGPGSDSTFAGRDPDVVRRYQQGVAAAQAGSYRLAISNLQSVVRSDPSFPEAQRHLDETKAVVRGKAEGAFAEGGRLEKAGDFQGAVREYERSKEIAVMMYGEMTGADEAIARARASMTAAGSDAFKRARQFDALGRTSDAVAMYAKALDLLASDDPNRQVAQERLNALRK